MHNVPDTRLDFWLDGCGELRMKEARINERIEAIRRQIFPVNGTFYRPIGVEQKKSGKAGEPNFNIMLEEVARDGASKGGKYVFGVVLPLYDMGFDEDGLFMLNRTDHSSSYHHTLDGVRAVGPPGFTMMVDFEKALIAYAMMLDNEYCGAEHDPKKLFR